MAGLTPHLVDANDPATPLVSIPVPEFVHGDSD